MHCVDCIFWKKEDRYGMCTNIKLVRCCGIYSMNESKDEAIFSIPEENVAVKTGENFGCIHLQKE